jgi:hypothetical protein
MSPREAQVQDEKTLAPQAAIEIQDLCTVDSALRAASCFRKSCAVCLGAASNIVSRTANADMRSSRNTLNRGLKEGLLPSLRITTAAHPLPASLLLSAQRPVQPFH